MRCSICPLSTTYRTRLLPDGPPTAQIAFLGDRPSRDDDRKGLILSGKAGSEFNELYLPLAGLYRGDIWVHNAVSCSARDYSPPTPEESAECSGIHLGPLLTAIYPVILVPMGTAACGLFPEIEDLNLQHGVPLPGKWGGWQGVLFPVFHPSAGIHSTGYMISLTQDFKELGRLVTGMKMRGILRA